MRDVIIAPKDEAKSRTFRAVCLASIEADPLWEGGATAGDKHRPIFAVFAGSDGDLRPFMANLRLGRQIIQPSDSNYGRNKGEKMEFLRSADYQQLWQRMPEGSTVTVTLPDLVRMDPGMVDPEIVRFVMVASEEYLSSQKTENAMRAMNHARKAGTKIGEVPEGAAQLFVATSMLFTAMLDRRTRCPIVGDARFHTQLFCACLREGLASYPTEQYGQAEFGCHKSLGLAAMGMTEIGAVKPVAFQATHERLEELLASEVEMFFKLTKGRA